ncbi:MAG: hypothetical protein JWQ40_2979 [Segetibacter sp.]|jgi:PhnB protein|nr:hypothetical protein [Segetibacter sp.]
MYWFFYEPGYFLTISLLLRRTLVLIPIISTITPNFKTLNSSKGIVYSMENLQIPEGYQRVMPYLILKNAHGFFDFAVKVFEAKEKMKIMRDDYHIMHAELQIGESIIMFADSTDEFQVQNGGFFIYVNDADEAYNKALAEGATVRTALSNQDYGRSGGVTDPFGNVWWITSAI